MRSRPGTVTGFLGPNGAGKSTMMRMIMGLDRPDAGPARISGKSYGDLRWPLRAVGALLEAKAFHPAAARRRSPQNCRAADRARTAAPGPDVFAKLGLPPGDTQHRRVLAVLTYLRA